MTMPEDNPEERGEKVVRCPVDGCDAEHPTRGLHLHLMRSVGEGHGPQGEYPDIDVEDLEEVGRKTVDVDYPDERDSESVARLCPYCEKPFKGKNGVLIHLGLVEGRKNHPKGASAVHEPTDFPVVELDDDENIISVVSNPRAGEEAEYRENAGDGGDDGEAFATFSRAQMDYLYQAISEAGVEDEQVKMMLQRPYIEHTSHEDDQN
jgi:hypothetical protein